MQKGSIGTAEINGLLADYLKVILNLMDTAAGSTDRSYRQAGDWKSAAGEIKRFSKKDFDPVLVNAFLRA